MSVLFIGEGRIDDNFREIFKYQNLNVFFKSSNPYEKVLSTNNSIRYFSHVPVMGQTRFNDLEMDWESSFESVLKGSNNNFSGFELNVGDDGLNIIINSARIARDRMYVLRHSGGVYLSDDIRDLIPYSSKKVALNGIYSVLKFGDTPEIQTCVEGVFAVPVASYWKGSISELQSLKNIKASAFINYQKIKYDFIGGDLLKTEQNMDSIFAHYASKDVLIPISGGIDSSLINYKINDFKTESYPAYYLRFGKEDPEVGFAKKAAENTKADLNIYEMKSTDFIEAFHFQTDRARQPIGESSTIALAFFFKQCQIEDHLILDGTLADGCYGSTNYQKKIPIPAPKSKLRSRAEEKMASAMQLSRLPGAHKFFPRDSYVNNYFLQQLNIYVGPLGNTLFKNVKSINEELEAYFKYYEDLIEVDNGIGVDDWMSYSVYKMVNYASKNNTAKSFDNVGYKNEAGYPFMWKSVLEDQGHYTWDEKSKDGIIKYPLKKIIEKYVDSNFIYRKKVGLNSSFEDWVCTQQNKKFLYDLITPVGGLAERLMGKANLKKLLKHFMSGQAVHPNVSRMVINLAISQSWVQKNGLSF